MNKNRTPIGKFLAKLRVDHDETMAEMAARLHYSAMYLSNVENGRRKITDSMPERIKHTYQLNDEQLRELNEAVFLSPQNKIEVSKVLDVIAFLKSTAKADDYRYLQAINDLSHIIRKEVTK